MTTRKSDKAADYEKTTGTRRDVMKLSLAVAAFGTAMGIAGPGAAAPGAKQKDESNNSDRTGRPKVKTKVATGRARGPKERDKPLSTRRPGRPKVRDKVIML
jgi:hypothetical protein